MIETTKQTTYSSERFEPTAREALLLTTRIRIFILTAILAGAAVAAAQLFFPGGLAGFFFRGSEPAALYGCPMPEDAEVRSDKPGTCPKCGMDLVLRSRAEHSGVLPGANGPERDAEGPQPARKDSPAPSKHPEHQPGEKSAQKYYCPMHPTYTSDRPGDCPICNMKLVPLGERSAAGPSGIEGRAAVEVTSQGRRLIGVRTVPVERRSVSKTIRAVGRVEYSERTLSAVNLKFGGWIEDLYVRATGDRVRRGEPLFAIYSPELLEAQANYLFALNAARQSREAKVRADPDSADAQNRALASLEEAVSSAREKLLLWDLGEDALREIEARGEPLKAVVIRSKVDGIVTARNVVVGTYADPGKDLFEVADVSRVWIHAEIYEYEAPMVSTGMEAKAELHGLPGEIFAGKVAFVYPYLDERTRTLRARLEFENPEGKLRPGAYATVWIEVPLGERLVIEEGAILDSGIRKIAFVEVEEGRFEPREVETGPRLDGLVVIERGLEEGERVVGSGTFLIDAESRLQAALRGVRGGEHEH